MIRIAMLILLTFVLTIRTAFAFEPQVTVQIGDLPDTIAGETNFPDGTNLLIQVYRAGSRFHENDNVVVRDGKFRTKRLSYDGKPMGAGAYAVNVSTAEPDQPPAVESVLGQNGAKLTGPHIKLLIWPVYDQDFLVTQPGKVDPKSDAEFKRIDRDKEVSGIGSSCRSLYGNAGDSQVNACIDQALKSVPP